MAGSKTAYLSQRILDHCFGGGDWSPPANVWLVLSSQSFDPNANGGACNELTASDYTRLEVVHGPATWSDATTGAPSMKSNINDLAWPTATSDWGTPASVYLADAASDGNLLYGADLFAAGDVGDGGLFKILAGTFQFSED